MTHDYASHSRTLLALALILTWLGASQEQNAGPHDRTCPTPVDGAAASASGGGSRPAAVVTPVSEYSWILYEDGASVHAVRGDYQQESLHADLATAIAAVWSDDLSVYVKSGSYPVSQTIDLSGFNSTLVLDPGARLSIEDGAGTFATGNTPQPVFRLTGQSLGVRIRGGRLIHGETAEPTWTGVRFAATGKGNDFVYDCSVAEMVFDEPGTAIRLHVDEDGWINGNRFSALRVYEPVRTLRFSRSPCSDPYKGMDGNLFEHIDSQSGPRTVAGVVGLNRFSNVFVNVHVWDWSHLAQGGQGLTETMTFTDFGAQQEARAKDTIVNRRLAVLAVVDVAPDSVPERVPVGVDDPRSGRAHPGPAPR